MEPASTQHTCTLLTVSRLKKIRRKYENQDRNDLASKDIGTRVAEVHTCGVDDADGWGTTNGTNLRTLLAKFSPSVGFSSLQASVQPTLAMLTH